MVALAEKKLSLLDRLELDDDGLWEARAFADWCYDQDMAPKTCYNYYSDYTTLLNWYRTSYGSALWLRDITAHLLVEYKRHMRERGLKPATINRRLSAVKTACRCAIAVGIRTDDPSASLKQVPREQAPPLSLNRNERNALLRAVETYGSKRDLAMMHLMAYCGLRNLDIRQLALRDVHLEGKRAYVNVRRSKRGKDRDIFLPAQARASLRAYLEQRGSTWPDDHVFLSALRRGVSADAVHDVVVKYGRLAGIEPPRGHKNLFPHALRHTAARHLLKAGNDLVTVKEILGHDDIKTTARYCLPDEEDLAAAMARLEDEE